VAEEKRAGRRRWLGVEGNEEQERGGCKKCKPTQIFSRKTAAAAAAAASRARSTTQASSSYSSSSCSVQRFSLRQVRARRYTGSPFDAVPFFSFPADA